MKRATRAESWWSSATGHDTFGWGVVLSDETLENLAANDPESAAEIRRHFAYWDDIVVHHAGACLRSGGHGFCGIGRKRLLNILQDRCTGARRRTRGSKARSTASRLSATTT